jgi:hypothetical protein
MTRDEKLLVVAAVEVDNEENTFSGHNTRWSETVDMVLEGRKGLLDFTNEELDESLDDYSCIFIDEGLDSLEKLIAWARRTSSIDKIDSVAKTWVMVPAEEQMEWRKEEVSS